MINSSCPRSKISAILPFIMTGIIFCSFNHWSPSIPDRGLQPWERIVVGEQTEAEQLATIDLERYIAQVTGTVPEIIPAREWKKNPMPAVIVGSPDGNFLLRDLGPLKTLEEEGYYLAEENIQNTRVVIAAGRTFRGAVNAVYGLLKELGFGFYLGSEAIPESLPSGLGSGPIIRNPLFKIRGVLPWYNFFNSPTSWDPIDHRAFVDQLIRSGANFLMYHTYDTEPFAAYNENGVMKWGEPLVNTGTATWGTTPMLTKDFAFGTDKIYAGEYFGAGSTLSGLPRDEKIRKEQAIMRAGLDYAHKRGLFTGLGFSVNADPTNPEERSKFLRQINHVLDQYPNLDYIILWQEEMRGAMGYPLKYEDVTAPGKPPVSMLLNYGIARRSIFRRAADLAKGEAPFFQDTEEGRMARAVEGARLEQFAALARRAAGRRENPPGIVISGWGGDERLLSAEYYEGLDKLLPQDVVFSSLDHIIPRPRVDKIYHDLPRGRERWPIPWMEFDGDQWHPQPYVHVYEQMMKDIEKSGSQGILGIHWRTREVEETFGYMMAYAWQPGLSAEEFFKDLALRCYPKEIAGEMAAIHKDLDLLGYRWVGGGGQSECGNFSWGPGEEQKLKQLESLRERVRVLLPRAGRARERLSWMKSRMDWALLYNKAEISALKTRELIAKAGQAQAEERRKLAEQAKQILEQGELAKAMQTYARRISTRGEYGVLATINTKAAAEWNRMKQECSKILGGAQFDESLEQWSPEPEILLPRYMGSIEKERDLELFPLVLGGEKIWAYYRTVGGKKWNTLELKPLKGWVYHCMIPASALKIPAIELGFSFHADPNVPMSFGPRSITVMQEQIVDTAPRSYSLKESGKPVLSLKVKPGDVLPAELKWNDVPEADYYKVFRNGALIVETGVSDFPDMPEQMENTYIVEAWRDGRVLARSEPVRFAIPDQPITEKPALESFSNRSAVFLLWPRAESFHIKSYRIYRTAASEESSKIFLKEIPRVHGGKNIFRDCPNPGKWRYIIAPVNLAGREGSPSEIDVEYHPGTEVKPVIEWSMNERPGDTRVQGNVRFAKEGAQFEDGWLELAHQPWMNLDLGMTLSFEFKADRTDPMPVLISHGLWNADGWFVQIYQGALKLSTPKGEIFGPKIEPGAWYSVRFVYDGLDMRLAVNGHWNDKDKAVRISSEIPAKRPLIIGHYEIKAPEFAFHGVIRNVKILNDVQYSVQSESPEPNPRL